MNDSDLVARFIEGEAEAVATVEDWIQAVARHSAWGDTELAKDGAADTMLRVLGLLREGKFRGTASLKTYISRVARYTMIDLLRHRMRTRALFTDANIHTSTASTPETELLEKEEAHLFDRILGLIDEKCRRLWQQIFSEGLPYRQIAERENISETAVKMRAYHCKKAAIEIRKKLEDPLPPGDVLD